MRRGERHTAAQENKDRPTISTDKDHTHEPQTELNGAGSNVLLHKNQVDKQTRGSNQTENLEIQIPIDHISAGGPAKSLARSPLREQSDTRNRSTNIWETRLPPDGHEHPETYINGDSLSRKRIHISPGSYKQNQQTSSAGSTADVSQSSNNINIQASPGNKYEISRPGTSTFYPAVKLASPNKMNTDVTNMTTLKDEAVPDLPQEKPPSLPSGPPPPIPDEISSDLHTTTTHFSAKTVDASLSGVDEQNGTLIDLEFTASGVAAAEPRAQSSRTDSDSQHIRSYVDRIVTTAVTLAKQSCTTNSMVAKPAMPTLLIDDKSLLTNGTGFDQSTKGTEMTAKEVVSPSGEQSDLSSSASSLPTVRSLLLTSPRSYSGSRPGSRRSSIGSDAGSIASDISASMRGAAPPLKPARRESVIEALEKKRRESVGPKLKGLQLPSRRASSSGQSGPIKALPTIAGLPAVGEKKAFGIKPFRSVQPFSHKITDGVGNSNTTEVTLRTTTLQIRKPRDRWSYHGSDSVFDSPGSDTTAFDKHHPLLIKTDTTDRKPVEVKPVATFESFNKDEQNETKSGPSFHITVNKVETTDDTLMPKKPPPTAPKPAVHKPITIEVSSRNTDAKQHGALSPKSPPPTAPKPKSKENLPHADHQLIATATVATSKPSLPAKPQLKPKPKTSSSSEGSPMSPLLSPTSPRSVAEEEIRPIVFERTKPQIQDDLAPVQHEDLTSSSDISDLLGHDLEVASDRMAKPMSPASPRSPVQEPEIHAIIRSRTVKTETTVTFFPTPTKMFLEPEILPSESQTIKAEERKTLSPLPVKVSETREIIKIQANSSVDQHDIPDITETNNRNNSHGYTSPLSPSSPPPTQGPIPFHRVNASNVEEKETTTTSTHIASTPQDPTHHTFSLTLNVAPVRQGPLPFGTSPKQQDCDGKMENEKNRPTLKVYEANAGHVPPLPGAPPPGLPDCPPPPIPGSTHLVEDDIGQLSPAESGIRMDGSASDSATLESQSIDSLEDGLDYISSVPSSSNHSKTESEISITPSIDLSKPDSPASSSTLIQLSGDESHLQPRKAYSRSYNGEETSEGRASILGTPDGQALSPSPTPSETDSGIGSNKCDTYKTDKGSNLNIIFPFFLCSSKVVIKAMLTERTINQSKKESLLCVKFIY